MRKFLEAQARAVQQRVDALNAVDETHQRREHRGLVAAAGADLQHLARRAAFEQRLGHLRDHERLRDRLAVADRQRRVFVRARRERFVDEQVTRHVADLIEHLRVDDALLAQALDEPLARARGGHADAGAIARLVVHDRRAHASLPCSHARMSSSIECRVRSICSGVTET